MQSTLLFPSYACNIHSKYWQIIKSTQWVYKAKAAGCRVSPTSCFSVPVTASYAMEWSGRIIYYLGALLIGRSSTSALLYIYLTGRQNKPLHCYQPFALFHKQYSLYHKHCGSISDWNLGISSKLWSPIGRLLSSTGILIIFDSNNISYACLWRHVVSIAINIKDKVIIVLGLLASDFKIMKKACSVAPRGRTQRKKPVIVCLQFTGAELNRANHIPDVPPPSESQLLNCSDSLPCWH